MKKAVSLLLTFTLLIGCGCSSASSSTTWNNVSTTPSSNADRNGVNALSGMHLNILGSYHEDMVRRLAEMFETESGCTVSYLRIPTGEGVAKLTAEKDNPTFNVYIGGTVDAHESLKYQGILAAYHSPVENELPVEYIDPDGVWKAQYIETLSIGVNTERWEKEYPGEKIPTTLQDLLNPALRGEIITPDPSTSGTGYTFISSVLQLMGTEEGWKYIRAFNEQVGQYTISGYTAAEKAGLGEYLICVNFLADQLIVNISGYPLKSTVYEGAGWSICPVSVVSGSEKNIAAQKFIDFCISKRALDALVELANCVAVRNDCIAPQDGNRLSELNVNHNYSLIKAAADKADILKRFSILVDDE
ncbi:MAG: ABC transporter substrate-binding protein [Ruminococcaceae bacterium]|nr:ABC transporter substrate-binding protein [Oscillospiraceae bacterium]